MSLLSHCECPKNDNSPLDRKDKKINSFPSTPTDPKWRREKPRQLLLSFSVENASKNFLLFLFPCKGDFFSSASKRVVFGRFQPKRGKKTKKNFLLFLSPYKGDYFWYLSESLQFPRVSVDFGRAKRRQTATNGDVYL